MKKIFVAMVNEMDFLFNGVEKVSIDFPSEYNPYCEIVLRYENISEKTTLLENYLHENNKHYTKSVDYNKWLEYYSYSIHNDDIYVVYKLVGYRNAI